MIDRLKALQANRDKSTTSSGLSGLMNNEAMRAEVNALSLAFLHRSVSGCSNCYTDAYIELINLNIETAMNTVECKFRLLAGALLRDINGDAKYLCSQHNITNDLALYHLKTNVQCSDMFSTLPDDWEAMVDDYQLDKEDNAGEPAKSNKKLRKGKPTSL